MNFTKEDYLKMYRATYSWGYIDKKDDQMDLDTLWRGTFVEVFNNFFKDENKLFLDTIFFLPVFFFEFIPYFLRKVRKHLEEPVTLSKEEYKLDRKAVIEGDVNNGKNFSYLLHRREHFNTLNNKCSSNKRGKAEAIISLRKYLFQNNFTLKANELDGNITFGKDINEILNIILSSIVVLKNNSVEIKGGYKIIEERLSQLVQEEVKIEIIENKIKDENTKVDVVLPEVKDSKNIDESKSKLETEIEQLNKEMTNSAKKYGILALFLVGTILLLLSL